MYRIAVAVVAVVAALGGPSCGSDPAPVPDAATVDAASVDAPAADAGAQTACGPSSCDRGTEMCVQDIGIVTSYRCIAVPSGCEDDRSCSCAGVASCGAAVTCRDLAADNTIECCPKC